MVLFGGWVGGLLRVGSVGGVKGGECRGLLRVGVIGGGGISQQMRRDLQ